MRQPEVTAKTNRDYAAGYQRGYVAAKRNQQRHITSMPTGRMAAAPNAICSIALDVGHALELWRLYQISLARRCVEIVDSQATRGLLAEWRRDPMSLANHWPVVPVSMQSTRTPAAAHTLEPHE